MIFDFLFRSRAGYKLDTLLIQQGQIMSAIDNLNSQIAALQAASATSTARFDRSIAHFRAAGSLLV